MRLYMNDVEKWTQAVSQMAFITSKVVVKLDFNRGDGSTHTMILHAREIFFRKIPKDPLFPMIFGSTGNLYSHVEILA